MSTVLAVLVYDALPGPAVAQDCDLVKVAPEDREDARREIRDGSREFLFFSLFRCFNEPECHDECSLVETQECTIIHRQECKPVVKEHCTTVDEPVCSTVLETKCSTVSDRQCSTGRTSVFILTT